MNATGLPPSPPSSPKSTAVVGGAVVGEVAVVVDARVVVDVSAVVVTVVASDVVGATVGAVVEGRGVGGAVVGGEVVGGAVVGGAVVAVVATGGWGVEVQSLPLRVGAGDVVAPGGVNLGGGIFAATLSRENDHPSNVPGGGGRLPAPSVA